MSNGKTIPIIEPYNPLDKANIGNRIANELMNHAVENLPVDPFIGAGVYAIFFVGDNEIYKELGEFNRNNNCPIPIYVGKAVPQGARKGGTGIGENQGPALQKRLGDHTKSINEAEDLSVSDFKCRYIVVDDIWIPLAESLMITRFKPVWNSVIDGFGNHDPGSGRKGQVQSPWDMLHPGRPWAKKLPTGPKDQDTLRRLVRYYIETNKLLQKR